MAISVVLVVKGTRYYGAPKLYEIGQLKRGAEVFLEHDPNNPHDKNAVEVRLNNGRVMLGHVSRDLAPKYVGLLRQQKVVSSVIFDADLKGKHLNVKIQTIYEETEQESFAKKHTRLWVSANSLPRLAGVYSIRNIETGQQYIGSSIDIHYRLKSHLRDLTHCLHANGPLQGAFDKHGPDSFEVRAVEVNIEISRLPEKEAEVITKLLRSGASLYNLTADGQGRAPIQGRSPGMKTISDLGTSEPNNKQEELGDKKHGYGTLTFADGSKYVGEWLDNMRHGRGRYVFSDGGEYDGEWRNGKHHGHGTLTFADGDEYDGEWCDGEQHGHGRYVFSSGSKYVGEWCDGKRHGRGRYVFSDGGEYDGECINRGSKVYH